ncbi:MAG: SurA N-terminal domain-containing protein [Syntrophobacterales bacterium]|jgi:peptidyl-prolyl cis-trans isomerase D
MLGLMRKHATSWLIKVALFAIVIVFIFWGGYSYTERRASRVAAVNGSYIGIREYQSTYNSLVEQMRRQFGDQFSSDLAEALNLKGQALERLINRRLLLAEARKLDLEISREELQQAIVSYPAFQTNGRFDPLRYQRTLSYLRLTPQEFEASQSEDLLIGKVQSFIARGAKVLDSEVLSFFHHTRDKVNLAYIQIDPQKFTDQVALDDGAIKGYFDENRETYRLAAKRNMIFVRFVPQDFLDEVEPTDAEVEDFYRLNQDGYQKPKKVRARHILFPIAPQATGTALRPIQERAKEVLALARKGDDFATLARKYSKDSTASKGGDLGYFTRTDMVKPFADAAFSMQKGEISDLVRTRFGLHIIKVEDIKESVPQPLDEVREAVIQSLKEERARDIALQRAEAFIDESRALDDLQKAAAAQGLEVKETGFFAADEAIPQLGRYAEINEIIFSLQPMEVSPALAVGEARVVAQLMEIQDSRIPELAEVLEKVRKDWIAEQSRVLARKQAEEWLETARQEGTLTEVARRNKLEIRKTDPFTALSPAELLANQRDLVITAFALTPEEPVAPEVYEINNTFAIFQLEGREPALEEEFQKEKDNLARNLLRIKQEQTFNLWITARRQQSDIKILQEL